MHICLIITLAATIYIHIQTLKVNNCNLTLLVQLNKWMCNSVHNVLAPSGPCRSACRPVFFSQRMLPCQTISALRPLAISLFFLFPIPFPCSSPCLACQPHITRSPSGSLAIDRYVFSLWRCKELPAKMKRAEVKVPNGSTVFSHLVSMLQLTSVFLQFSSLQDLFFTHTHVTGSRNPQQYYS